MFARIKKSLGKSDKIEPEQSLQPNVAVDNDEQEDLSVINCRYVVNSFLNEFAQIAPERDIIFKLITQNSTSNVLEYITNVSVPSLRIGKNQSVSRFLNAVAKMKSLETLDLSDNYLKANDIAQFLSSPSLSCLRSLNLSNNVLESKTASLIASSRYLTKLTSLKLCGTFTDSKGAADIAQSQTLSRLEILDLSDNSQIKNSGVKAIASSPNMSNLTQLYLSNTGLTSDSVKALTSASSSKLSKLTVLDLGDNEIGTKGVKMLVSSDSMLTNLTSLNLCGNEIKDEGAQMISSPSSARVFSKLTFLDLSKNGLVNVSATALSKAQFLNNLTELYLAENNLTLSCAKDIAHSPSFANLTVLDLGHNFLMSADGIAAIAGKSSLLSNLTTLIYKGNNITNEGVNEIAQSTTLLKLTTLDLSTNELQDDSATTLASAAKTSLSNLTTLILVDNELEDHSAIGIITAFPNLQTLDLRDNRYITPNGINQMKSLRSASLKHLKFDNSR